MSRREALVGLLADHAPADADEATHLDRMRTFAQELADPLSRDEPTAHFTASALVLDPARQRTYLVHHRKLGRWLQPGGHVEPDDRTLLETALREADEETALPVAPLVPKPVDVDIHEFPARDGRSAHLHLDVRFLLVADGSARAAAAESGSWFGRAEALEVADEPGLRRLLAKGFPE